MGPQADNDLDLGFDALIETSGEEITFRGRTLTVLIDRAPGEEVSNKLTPDFSERERTTIALYRSAVTPPPRSGETATDSYGHSHRVLTVEPRGGVYYLHCKVTAS